MLGTENIKMMMVVLMMIMILMMLMVMTMFMMNASHPAQISIQSTLFILANGLLTKTLGGWYYYSTKYMKDENTEAHRG